MNGIEAEFGTIDFGDKRLDNRSQMVLASLNSNPQTCINAACDGWAESKAAYRLFDNPRLVSRLCRETRVAVALPLSQATTLLAAAGGPPAPGKLRRLPRPWKVWVARPGPQGRAWPSDQVDSRPDGVQAISSNSWKPTRGRATPPRVGLEKRSCHGFDDASCIQKWSQAVVKAVLG